jgi:protein tyrosine phosphatase (PTP) superfamily phosphohydrolase (DUF442 family)
LDPCNLAENPGMTSDISQAPSASTQRAIRWVLGIGLLCAATFGIYWYVNTYWPYWHFRTVEEGKFYRSSQLGEKELGEAIDRYGLKTIFNLRDVDERTHGAWYETEVRVAEEHGARVIDIPLKAGTPPSPEQIAMMLEIMDDEANLPVLAHCYHGSIRSAAAEGLFRREYLNEDGAEAFDGVETWGRDLEEDYPLIADFIKDYVARRDRAKAPKAPQAGEPVDSELPR